MGVIAKSCRPKNCLSVIDPLVNPHEDLTNSVDSMYMTQKRKKKKQLLTQMSPLGSPVVQETLQTNGSTIVEINKNMVILTKNNKMKQSLAFGTDNSDCGPRILRAGQNPDAIRKLTILGICNKDFYLNLFSLKQNH